VFSDQFASIMETVRAAANLIPLVAPDDCGQSLFADTSVSNYYYAAQRKYCASCHAFLTDYEVWINVVLGEQLFGLP